MIMTRRQEYEVIDNVLLEDVRIFYAGFVALSKPM